MTDFLHRQWVMLSLLPRSPRVVDTATLEERLREQGVRANRRSIQRDLVALSALFPIVCDERSKPYGWAWADGTEVSSSSPHVAIDSKLVRSITHAAGAIRAGVLDVIVNALVDGRRCVIVRKGLRKSTQTLDPMALTFRHRSPYVLGAIDGKMKQVPLCAISSAKISGEAQRAAKPVLDLLAENEPGRRHRKTGTRRGRRT